MLCIHNSICTQDNQVKTVIGIIKKRTSKSPSIPTNRALYSILYPLLNLYPLEKKLYPLLYPLYIQKSSYFDHFLPNSDFPDKKQKSPEPPILQGFRGIFISRGARNRTRLWSFGDSYSTDELHPYKYYITYIAFLFVNNMLSIQHYGITVKHFFIFTPFSKHTPTK